MLLTSSIISFSYLFVKVFNHFSAKLLGLISLLMLLLMSASGDCSFLASVSYLHEDKQWFKHGRV